MNNDFCGMQTSDNQNILQKTLLYVYMIIIIYSIIACIQLFIKWINYMDYFPLKQRSPLLSIALLFTLVLSINIFPIQVAYYYFSSKTKNNDNKTFRIFYYGLRYLSYFIYALRSIRIAYAYNVQKSMRNSIIFKFFSKQLYLVGIVILLLIVRIIPVLVFQKELYVTPIDRLDNPDLSIDYNLIFIKNIFQSFPWQIILLICLWIQRQVKPQYGIRLEILAVLVLNLIATFAQIIMVSILIQKHQSFQDIIKQYSCYNDQIPIEQLCIIIHNFIMLIITIILPLYKIRYHHTLLPIQQVYDLDQNLKSFLLDPLCYKIFLNFLYELKQTESSSKQKTQQLKLMQFWSRITIFKLDQDSSLQDLGVFFSKLDQNIFDKKIIKSLNYSFGLLKQHTFASDREKIQTQINRMIDELQKIVIKKISIVYKTSFRRTRAYYKLKEIMHSNDKINTNLLMLNMTLRQQKISENY